MKFTEGAALTVCYNMDAGRGNFLHIDVIQARHIIPGDNRKEGNVMVGTPGT